MGPNYANAPDAELIGAGRADAFAVVYDRPAAIYDWARSRVGDHAADLTAETFARAWLSRGSFRDAADGSAFPWLPGIAQNLLRDSLRRQRIDDTARARLGLPRELVIDAGYELVEERLSLPEAALKAIADLPEADRQVLDLRVVEGRPYSEIAAAAELHPGRRAPPGLTRATPSEHRNRRKPVRTDIPDILVTYRNQLHGAIERDLARGTRTGRFKRRALALGVPATAAVATTATVLLIAGGASGPSAASAAIIRHVRAELTAPAGSILHESATVTLPDGSSMHFELWTQAGTGVYRVIKFGQEASQSDTKNEIYDPSRTRSRSRRSRRRSTSSRSQRGATRLLN